MGLAAMQLGCMLTRRYQRFVIVEGECSCTDPHQRSHFGSVWALVAADGDIVRMSLGIELRESGGSTMSTTRYIYDGRCAELGHWWADKALYDGAVQCEICGIWEKDE